MFASVLEVVYLVFNEGYAATAGDDLLRLVDQRGAHSFGQGHPLDHGVAAAFDDELGR